AYVLLQKSARAQVAFAIQTSPPPDPKSTMSLLHLTDDCLWHLVQRFDWPALLHLPVIHPRLAQYQNSVARQQKIITLSFKVDDSERPKKQSKLASLVAKIRRLLGQKPRVNESTVAEVIGELDPTDMLDLVKTFPNVITLKVL